MSLSKKQVAAVAAAEQPRQPKCARCRHHGIIVPQKGHTKYCPFLHCDCWRCFLISERTRVATLQRNLKRAQHNPHSAAQPTAALTGDRAERAAAGGARPSHTSPQSTGTPEGGATDRRPLDVRCGPAGGPDSRQVLAYNGGPYTVLYFGEFGQSSTLPHYLSSYPPYPNHMLNPLWWPPVPAGLDNQGLCTPMMFPRFQQGAVHCPPPPEPRPSADCRQVFFTLQPPPLPEAFQEELMFRQNLEPPVAKPAEPDIGELD